MTGLLLGLSLAIPIHAQRIATTFAGTSSTPPIEGALAAGMPIGASFGMTLDAGGSLFFSLFDVNVSVVVRLTADGRLHRVAGSGPYGFSGDSGLATSATLARPSGLAFDHAGNLYVADAGNSRIRKVSPDGTISTIAGNGQAGYIPDGTPATIARLGDSPAVAVDGMGNLFIAGGGQVLKVIGDGTVVTVAGGSQHITTGDGGPAIGAELHRVIGIAFDSAGNMYIADIDDHRIRKVSPVGVITTVAGNGNPGFSGDGGKAIEAQLHSPGAIAVTPTGVLYIADGPNHRVRKVTPDGIITTVAGNGQEGYSGDGMPAASASLNDPTALLLDAAGNLYVSESMNRRIRKITADGIISTVAGKGPLGFSGDGGQAASARLNAAYSIALDGKGNVYASDNANHRVRKIAPNGVITTVAGTAEGFSGDGGPATAARLNSPNGIGLDAGGTLYIADSGNYRIRKVTPDGNISTVAGTGDNNYYGDGGPALNAGLAGPYAVALDADGDVYFTDVYRVRKLTKDGNIQTVAGNGQYDNLVDGGLAINAFLYEPSALAFDAAGNLYIADTFHGLIRRVTTDGIINTIAGDPRGLGSRMATSTYLGSPQGVAVDSMGNFYIADSALNQIYKVTADGIIVTVAGNGQRGFAGDGGPAASATLSFPEGLALDAAGNIFVADAGNVRIRKVSAGTGCDNYLSGTDVLFIEPTANFSAAGGKITISVYAGPSCTWSISGLPDWITVSGTSAGTGPGVITLIIAPNNGALRSAALLIADVPEAINQEAPPWVASGPPNSAVQTFSGRYPGTRGYQDLQWVQMLMAVATDGGGQPFCLVHYDVQGNKFWLYSDVQGFFVGPITPGVASNLLQGSLCALNTLGSSVSADGFDLTMNANLVFKQALALNIFMRGFTLEGVDSGWVQQGTWTTVAASLGTMTVSPSSGGVANGTQQIFTLTYPDPAGFAGAPFGWEQFLIGTATDGGGNPFCYVHYDRTGNGLWMYSGDAGFFLGPVIPGAVSSLLTSSACSINTEGATVANTSGNLVLTVPIVFKAPMVRGNKLFQRTLDVLNRDTGFQQTGTWTVN